MDCKGGGTRRGGESGCLAGVVACWGKGGLGEALHERTIIVSVPRLFENSLGAATATAAAATSCS